MTATPLESGHRWVPGAELTTVLCDADGTLFPSEDPAFEASAVVTRELAEQFGLSGDFSAEGLRRASTGRNFRATTAALFDEFGVEVDGEEVERWIEREKRVVTAHLANVLTVDGDVVTGVRRLAECFALAVVSSSARSRLDACLSATGLADWFPLDARFSAEDSLATPVSKPDPAIYLHAASELAVQPGRAVALEDSVAGVRAAVQAGIEVVGIVGFVPQDERPQRSAELTAAGAVYVAQTWTELVGALLPTASRC